ncbi:MAG: RagB/SusD family nutrient uptake outer membrane protein [Zunongwangia sp.]|nr:RagB/SusD family nutrient uptake outer membrane protein [Zunongwangia sp.]MAS72175.1 RagB/SusD family nutrient uptake outer membrane protein [Zunongwangia sp.]HCV80188.1 RagB/SusD family nutrient uptake outer membrane protein [Zunongwangia profunda]|tara:strand:- start:345 stop:1973 length:1629 start_codon:yes stop_codon:yes gene_type:complete
MKRLKYNKFFFCLLCFFGIVGCTDLDESLYSEVSKSNFYNSKLEIIQATLRPFTHMQAWLAFTGQNGYYYHNELSADQVAWPQKGRHAYDNGDHIRQHYHTWTTEESRLLEAWSLMWTGLGYVNAAIEDIEQVDPEAANITQEELESFIAESKVLRAYHYMKIMDMWGNVPIVTEIAKPGSDLNPATQSREEVFAFIEQELLDNVEKLQPLSPQLLGRVSKAVGYAMLSEFYLNAEVWSGEARWADCIKYSDKVINGEGGSLTGTMMLDQDPLGPYNNTNEDSPENIFQFPFSRQNDFGYNWTAFYAGFDNMKDALDVTYAGWNAFVVIPSAFDAYKENDIRKQEWFLFGPQYEYGTTEPILGTEEYRNQPLIYVNNIRRNTEGQTGQGSMTDGEENSGARFHKYRSGVQKDENYLENDFVIYRLTEMYFNKAEALMRQNGGGATSEAVSLINESKSRYFTKEDWPNEMYTTANFTLNELLVERGREFIFEGKRRTDLIRFDRFTTGSWWDKTPDGDDHTELYPIPYRQVQTNPNIEQNPGY